MTCNIYLQQILQKYNARDLSNYSGALSQLQSVLKTWASSCYLNILNSGSCAKGTAISLASDVDYLVSLSSNCNENIGGLKSIYESLFSRLVSTYPNLKVRKQNVSVRISFSGLEVDVTPARKQSGNTNNHWLYVSKFDTRKQTNIQRHIKDVSASGRTNEIMLLKIWRELNNLDFPSIYLEYLLINIILFNKPKDISSLADNTFYALKELAKDTANPLYVRIIDPANSANVLSDLLDLNEKNKIISKAKIATQQTNWKQIIW